MLRRWITARRTSGASSVAGFFPRTLAEWVEIVTNCFLAGSAVFAVLEYGWSLQRERVAHTLSFSERFDGEHYSKAREVVDQLASHVRSEAARAHNAEGVSALDPPSRQKFEDQLFRTLVYSTGNDGTPQLPPAFVEVASFYNELEICVDRSVCDRSTAHAFFDKYALGFWNDFKTIIFFERTQGRPEFAREMEHFLKDAREGR